MTNMIQGLQEEDSMYSSANQQDQSIMRIQRKMQKI